MVNEALMNYQTYLILIILGSNLWLLMKEDINGHSPASKRLSLAFLLRNHIEFHLFQTILKHHDLEPSVQNSSNHK